jgi:uncharacterized protein YbjT (DUF2867 family)
MKTAIVVGATGLVGTQLLGLLLESKEYAKVIALTRKPLLWKHEKLKTVLFDFDRPDKTQLIGDDLFCCLGTTLKAAGSKEAQKKIDHDYPMMLGKLGREQGVQRFVLVSSVGADAHSNNFYLSLKGQLEQGLGAMGFEAFIAVRPSFLLGDRTEFRFGEQVGIGMIKVFGPLLFGSWKKYRGIEAKQVAKAMIRLANDGKLGVRIAENDILAEA